MANSRFDRLAGVRRNRRLRNWWSGVSGLCLFVSVILALDPLVSGSEFRLAPVLIFSALFVASLAATIYFHMRFLSRE